MRGGYGLSIGRLAQIRVWVSLGGTVSRMAAQYQTRVTRTCLINTSLCVDLPFDRLRANGKGENPFVLSLSKHKPAYRVDL